MRQRPFYGTGLNPSTKAYGRTAVRKMNHTGVAVSSPFKHKVMDKRKKGADRQGKRVALRIAKRISNP